MYANNNYDGSGDNPYTIFDKRGNPKNIGWSVASAVSGGLSIFFSIFGWAGLIFGVFAIIFSILARRSLGYFNGWAVVGLLIGIVGMVFSTSLIIIAYTNPEMLKELLGFVSVPGSDGGVTPPSINDNM